MFIIIPLGGFGKRFKKCGYSNPKPLINVFGKPIINWLFDNLNTVNITQILIPYNKELFKYNFEDSLKISYPKLKFTFLKLEEDTRGAAESIYMMLNKLSNTEDCPIISLDGDNFYNCDIISLWNGENKIFTFEDYSNDPIYSYVKLYKDKIIDIVEKEKISNYACSGSYGFNSWISLKNYCKLIIDNTILQKGEFYISTVVKTMINYQNIFYNELINKKDYICLGTPLHVKIFCNNYPRFDAYNKKSLIDTKRICFDLDNTLVSYPKVKNDYTTVEPIEHNINYLRYLKEMGNTIIIHTARRMKTHHGNNGKLLKDIGLITFETLAKFNIPYDEIYFGKPYADFYIDDKGINAFADLDKELGYYNFKIEPRYFNNISLTNSIEVLKKSSDNLEGQINYYLNIPNSLKDIFPYFFNHDATTFKWYDMEKINGIAISNLYIKEELTIELLDSIIGTINRLHSIKSNDSINIYENYSKKLKTRFSNYNYSTFPNYLETYNKIKDKLEEYENKNLGICRMIHGDLVLTNVIVNSYGKIKFIDMRGKINDQVTIFGDIFYDYAKLYQSFTGYDEILLDKKISVEYKNNILAYFKKNFLAKYGEELWEYLQYLTASLYYTLIPLHNNNKCPKYYNIISKLI